MHPMSHRAIAREVVQGGSGPRANWTPAAEVTPGKQSELWGGQCRTAVLATPRTVPATRY